MNIIDAIKIIYTFLDDESNDSYRQCNKHLMHIIGPIYFKNISITFQKIINNGLPFKNFMQKYDLFLNLTNVMNTQELYYLQHYYKIKSIKFNYSFNEEIKTGVLPESLQKLTFGYSFNREIKEGVLPLSLQKLTFGQRFNQELKEGVLPQSLISLKFGVYFNQELKEHTLPHALQVLKFGIGFNQKINIDFLPMSTLKKIMINKDYWIHSPELGKIYSYLRTNNIRIKNIFIKCRKKYEDSEVIIL